MGVSLISNRRFSKANIARVLSALPGRPFVLLLADSLEAVNYRFLRGQGPAEARSRARSTGENYLRGYQKLRIPFLNLYPVLASDLESTALYERTRDAVDTEFRTNKCFRVNIQREVIDNLGNQASRYLASIDESARLEAYLLGEVALSLTLYGQARGNRLIQVSPKRGGILASLEAFPNLLRRVHLSPADCQYNWIGDEGVHLVAA